MSPRVSKQTAMDIALAHREIEVAEDLLAKVREELGRGQLPDVRDVFGRRKNGLQLGVPTGESSHRLFDVPWNMAEPIIEAHIASQRNRIAALEAKLLIELQQSGGE